jgi:uncharacterized pyridoxamine 5'-phosphate oxidase family protein
MEMEQIIKYLRAVPAFYVATVEGNQPRVRPFSLVYEWEGKLSFGLNDNKKVYAQLSANPYVEICAYQPEEETWMRIWGEVKLFKNIEMNRKIFETMPSLKEIYGDVENPSMVAMSIVEGQADIYTFASDMPVATIQL